MTSLEVQRFMNAGLSFIPVGRDKKPWVESWTKYQYRRPDPDELGSMKFLDAPGVAVIAGDVSGGVECIDFDIKNDPTGKIWEEFNNKIEELGLVDILAKTYIQQTSSGGYHVVYRCTTVGRNQKLALPEASREPIIETRGNGGYFLVAPSERYEPIQGGILQLETITDRERDLLIGACKSLTRQKDTGRVDQPKPIVNREFFNWDSTRATVEKICVQIENAKVDLTSNYEDWIKIGFGLAHSLQEEGRSYFHRVSQFHPNYSIDDTNQKFDSFRKTLYKNKHVTVKSFYALAASHGIDISDGNNTDDPIQKWVRSQALKYDEMSKRILDRNGDKISDMMLNTLYRRCKAELRLKFSMSEFTTYVFNTDNLHCFNPIMDFFEPLRFRHYEGSPVSDYIDHLELKDERWKPIIRRWMLSVVAQAYGYNSEIVLVLVGPLHIGKTQFFLRMFPEEFRSFCVVSALKEGKDSQILMTQKLVIVDDEFGGLNQKDAQHFKALVSQEWFSIRMPYGRVIEDVRKLSVLAGASNKTHVINDYTGNRRILPVEVISRDFAKADSIDRYDMWAELVQEYWQMEMVEKWEIPKEEIEFITAESEQYQQVNAPKEYITQYFSPGTDTNKGLFVTATQVTDFINEKHPNAKLYANRVGMELVQLGFERVCKKRGKIPIWGYYAIEADGENDEEEADVPF